MNIELQIFIIVLAFLFIVYIYNSVKNRIILLKYALLWIIPVLFVIFITIFPNSLNLFLKTVGIKTLSNMMFLFTIVFLAFISFTLTIIVSKQKQQIIILTQELGILQNNFKILENRLNGGKSEIN